MEGHSRTYGLFVSAHADVPWFTIMALTLIFTETEAFQSKAAFSRNAMLVFVGLYIGEYADGDDKYDTDTFAWKFTRHELFSLHNLDVIMAFIIIMTCIYIYKYKYINIYIRGWFKYKGNFPHYDSTF